MIPRTLLLFATLLATLLTFSGCALQTVPGPDISLVDAEFVDVTLLETEIEFTIRLHNQTPTELTVNGAVYRVTLNKREIGSGSTGERLVIPPFARDEHRVRIALSNWGFINQIKTLVEAKRFDYDLDAQFYLDRAGLRRARTEHSGRFDFQSGDATFERRR
jgi:LEA14-like dessication related protein